MTDGITIKYIVENWEAWKRLINTEFKLSIFEDSGELPTKKRDQSIVTTHTAKWETFDLIVKEVLNIATGTKVYHLTIKGSLHKNYYAGKNYLPFTWQQLQQQINHLCKTLHLNPSQAQISTLEIGVNIITPFTVTPFLRDNIINYKGESFTRWPKDKTGFCLGIYCDTTQYRVKIYDKGKQNDLPHTLMRFEKRFFRMQPLNKLGIKNLADLLNRDKIFNILANLLSTWQNVLIYDFDRKIILTKPELEKWEIELLTHSQYSLFWEQLKETNNEQFKYQRKKYKTIVAKYGNNWPQLVNQLIENQWHELFKNSPNLHSGRKLNVVSTFPEFTIKIKGKNEEKRFCQCCGHDITHQRKSSKSCSPKYVGEALAHKCRNGSSNPKNNFKRKMELLQDRGLLFDILPYIVQKELQQQKKSVNY